MNSTPYNPSSSQIHQNYYNYHQHQHQQEDGKEHMFEKPLTPSDVGKLNRLVIPKQHAEKYFPLSSGTTESAEKGFLLSFEDELGKPWRFRYSYWTSSQSYVLTKGWSRFVKEKQLDAGDVVSFERLGVDARRFDALNNNNNNHRFFIRCRRRSGTQAHVTGVNLSTSNNTQPVVPGANVLWAQAFYHAQDHRHHYHHPYSTHLPVLDLDLSSSSDQSQHPCLEGDAGEAVAVGEGNAMKTQGNWKRVRLFGVNLDCQMEGTDPQGPECSGLPGQDPAHFVFSQHHGPTHYNHMPR